MRPTRKIPIALLGYPKYRLCMADDITPPKDELPAADLLSEIEAFCQEHNMPVSIFGGRALNDFAFVSALRKGRDPGSRTRRKVEGFMAAYAASASQNSAKAS